MVQEMTSKSSKNLIFTLFLDHTCLKINFSWNSNEVLEIETFQAKIVFVKDTSYSRLWRPRDAFVECCVSEQRGSNSRLKAIRYQKILIQNEFE